MELPLKYLDSGAMLAITGHWIEDKSFASITEVKALLPQIRAAHEGLLSAKPAQATTDPKVTGLAADLKATDQRHDHALRACFYLLTAAEEHALALDPPDPERAAMYAEARTALFPMGLGGVRVGYLAEEGNAKQAAAAVEAQPELARTIDELRLDKKTSGTVLLKSYVDLAGAVGDLDRKRSAAAATAGAAETPATFATATNAWIGIVGTVVRVLGHVRGAAATDALRSVVEPAQKAAAAAARPAKPKAPTGDGGGSSTKPGG